MRMPRRSRDLQAVVDHDPLGTILADPLRFKHINVVDQLSQQWCCQVIHLHKPPHSKDEALPLLLLLSGFGQLLAKGGDLTFQRHSLYFILMGQLHKPLIADLSGGVVLIEFFIEPGNGVVPGHRLLQFL